MFVHSYAEIITLNILHHCQDGTTIAMAVVGSKVKSITKDIEGAIVQGEDEEKESEAVIEFERMKVDKGFRRNQQQWERERERERERESHLD